MKTIIRRSLVILCLSAASPVLAQADPVDQPADNRPDARRPSDRSGPYIAIGGGLVLPERLRTDAGVSARLDDGFMGLVAVGGRVGPFRGEVEGSYRRASIGDASGFGLTATGIGNVSALSAMGNLYLEPSFGLGAVRPYFGGGAGVVASALGKPKASSSAFGKSRASSSNKNIIGDKLCEKYCLQQLGNTII